MSVMAGRRAGVGQSLGLGLGLGLGHGHGLGLGLGIGLGFRFRRAARVAGAVVLVAVGGAALAGCTSTAPAPPPVTVTVTAPSTAVPEAGGPWTQQYLDAGAEKVRWGDDLGSHIILTTYGSGSCPSKPDTLTVVDSTTIAVTIPDPGSILATAQACTADLRPTAFAAERPAELDPTKTITVLLGGAEWGTLPPLGG